MSNIRLFAAVLLIAAISYDNGRVNSTKVWFSKSYTLSQDVKNYVLALHNNFRADVAAGRVGDEPRTSVMSTMWWDDKIAAFAQESANKCDLLEHRKDRTLSGVGWVGENTGVAPLFKDVGSDGDLKAQFFTNIGPTKNTDYRYYGWADEHNSFFYPTSCYSGYKCGHYTQMVWAKTSRVGCGIAQCSGCQIITKTDLCTNMYCNYYEAGNLVGAAPY